MSWTPLVDTLPPIGVEVLFRRGNEVDIGKAYVNWSTGTTDCGWKFKGRPTLWMHVPEGPRIHSPEKDYFVQALAHKSVLEVSYGYSIAEDLRGCGLAIVSTKITPQPFSEINLGRFDWVLAYEPRDTDGYYDCICRHASQGITVIHSDTPTKEVDWQLSSRGFSYSPNGTKDARRSAFNLTLSVWHNASMPDPYGK